MQAGFIGTDAYLNTFRWGDMVEQTGSAKEVAESVAQALEQQFDEIDWKATAMALRNKT
jgi:hypothetical protein